MKKNPLTTSWDITGTRLLSVYTRPPLPAGFQVSSVVWSATVHPTKIHRCYTALPTNHLLVSKHHRGDMMFKKFSMGTTNSASIQVLAISNFQHLLTLETEAELRCPVLISLISADDGNKEGERDLFVLSYYSHKFCKNPSLKLDQLYKDQS